MTKKCLGCGTVSDNNLFTCSACLDKVNEARSCIKLQWFLRKGAVIGLNRILTIFALVLLFAELAFGIIYLNKFQVPVNIQIIIFFRPALLIFLLYFLAGRVVGRYGSKLTLKQWSNRNFYEQSPLERLKDTQNLRGVLLLVVFLFVSAFIVAFIAAFADSLAGIDSDALPEILREFHYASGRLFAAPGLILGMSLLFYFDWFRGLKK
ncbi:hypothetical protein ACFL1E_06500 [Candidatus Omnitrophota bacterium]